MSDKIAEQLQKIQDLEKLRDQTQGMIDQSILDLIPIAGGKTFEHGGKFYQIRTPNVSRTDRQRKAPEHPFLCKLDESPKTAKGRAKLRKDEQKAAKAEADKADALARVETNLAAVLGTNTTSEEEDVDFVEADSAEDDIELDAIAASGEDDLDDDGIILSGGDDE